MKSAIALLLLLVSEFAICVAQEPPTNTTRYPLERYADCTVITPSAQQIAALDNALPRLELLRAINGQVRTIEDAIEHILKHVSVAATSRVCVEYNGFFWFSGMDHAGNDDGALRSGLAVNKESGQIYTWKQ